MKSINRQQTAAVRTPRTIRRQPIAVMTTFPAGKCAPVAAIPLLREESMRARVSIQCEMMETQELLANKVIMRVTAYVVPTLAFERFEGSRDQLDRSYMGEPQVEGGDVVPYIENHAMGTHGANAVYKTLGLHGKSTDQVNTAYLEAYNTIVNFRRKNRSLDLSQRTRLQADLAEAFWHDSRFADVLPSFDQAVIDGEVALEFVGTTGKLPVKGLYTSPTLSPNGTYTSTNGGTLAAPGIPFRSVHSTEFAGAGPHAYAELADAVPTLSLADLAMARKAQWFAKIRQRYEGVEDEWIIDMLMNGLGIPDQHLKQPMLAADVTVDFGQVKRYATDAENLTMSAVSGGAAVSFDINVPRLSVGGVVMVIVETMPQQLYERQQDPYLHLKTANHLDQLPDYVRDEMDPQKVDIVLNNQVDTAHATPEGVFGYWPMNSKWNSFGPRIGGNFYRPTTDAGTAGIRGRFWAQEDVNPTLSESFYLVKDLQTKVFLDDAIDPFQAAVSGGAVIEGNTVFGGMLVAETNNYDKVMEKVPDTQIDQGA